MTTETPPPEGYLQIWADGAVEVVSALPDNVLHLVDNGECDFVRVHDGIYERLAFFEPEDGNGAHRAEWLDID